MKKTPFLLRTKSLVVLVVVLALIVTGLSIVFYLDYSNSLVKQASPLTDEQYPSIIEIVKEIEYNNSIKVLPKTGDGRSYSCKNCVLNKSGVNPGNSAVAQPTVQDDSLKKLVMFEGRSCVVTKNGGVKCWGCNDTLSVTDEEKKVWGETKMVCHGGPREIDGLSSGVDSIGLGNQTICALTTSGGVKCSGINWFGLVGNGTDMDSYLPTDVVGLTSGVKDIDGAMHMFCALTDAGGVKCWGSFTKLNEQTWSAPIYKRFPTPVDVEGLSSGVKAISVENNRACAVTKEGAVMCWGEDYDFTNEISLTPKVIPGLESGVKDVDLGALRRGCAIMETGGVKCWGAGYTGGVPSGKQLQFPAIDVIGLSSGVKAISVGGLTTCAIMTSGALKCWGSNHWGQMGIDHPDLGISTYIGEYLEATDIPGFSTGVKDVTTFDYGTCVLNTKGEVYCFGQNSAGQLGGAMGGVARKNLVLTDSYIK